MPKILIVEDDPLIRRMYQSVFNFEKFEVQVAENGEVALSILEKFTPNIILLDVMMPKLSGVDTLKHIKANPKLKSIPVIVLTNLSGNRDAEVALSLGAIKFIVKSEMKPKQVVDEVNQILIAYTRDEIPHTI